MAYLAIARKWRPQRFEDLVGQTHVVRTLKNAILHDRIAHAYLFSGSRGVGKTSIARIFAKTVQCPHAVDAVPCNQCDECVAITEGRSIDVVEIDGASNNGVESVRALRDNVAYSPAHGRYKIYLIDEVHMLSISAFNALLKTLEEPPSHVVFLFATTDPQKIPVTILSRCQHFEFRRLTPSEIVDRMKKILAEEKPGALTDSALALIASYSDGSMRDALSLLDQILASQGTEGAIDEEKAANLLGVSDFQTPLTFLEAVFSRQTFVFLGLIQKVYESGIQLKTFAERCLEELRSLYWICLARGENAPLTAANLGVSPGRWESLNRLSEKASVIQLERMAQILSKVLEPLSHSSEPRFVLEMAAVRMSLLDTLQSLEAGEDRSPRRESEPPRPNPGEARPPQLQKPAPRPQAPPPMAPPPPPEEARFSPPPPPSAPAPRPRSAPESEALDFEVFVDFVLKRKPLLGALLGHGEFRQKEKNVLLTFDAGSFYERQASDTKTKSEIEAFLKNFGGPDLTLTLASSSGRPLQSLETKKTQEVEALKKEALGSPLVAQAHEVLGAQVVQVTVDP